VRGALTLLWVCTALVPAAARAGERPVIASARVYVAHSRIVSDLHCTRLFSEQIVGTVESGLPAVVELLYRVANRDDDDVHRGALVLRLQYDVWDDIYALDRGDTSLSFTSFTAMRNAVERMRRVPIVAIGDVEPGGVYSIEFSVAVHPLRGGEQKRIVGWVDETVRGKNDGSWREQILNVNDLIHRFFRRDRESTNRSDWFRTIMFTPATLPLGRDADGNVGGSRP
jgi:hypothetical protein